MGRFCKSEAFYQNKIHIKIESGRMGDSGIWLWSNLGMAGMGMTFYVPDANYDDFQQKTIVDSYGENSKAFGYYI